MNVSSSYVEMLNSGLNRPADDGARAYPAAALEIMLLHHAQQKVHYREATHFQQFCARFGWQLTQRQQNSYLRRLQRGYTLILTDADKVILWASHNFMYMTGYEVAEAIGQRPSLLQGPDTDPITIGRIRAQLEQTKPVRADILNYRKDGTSYTCRVSITPLTNTVGELTHFLAVECDVAQPKK